jgi:CTP:molybdopterin cytidylyltransferase MocA
MKFAAIIIAGGFSKRFGSFKPVAEYNNKKFINSIVEKLDPVCEKIIIVTGFNNIYFEKYLQAEFLNNSKIKWSYNFEYEKGMISSILHGLKTLNVYGEKYCVFFQPVDIPHVNELTYKSLADYAALNTNFEIIKPSYNFKGGHPVIFHKNIIDNMISLIENNSDFTLRDVLKNFKTSYFTTDDKAVIEDFDFPPPNFQ